MISHCKLPISGVGVKGMVTPYVRCYELHPRAINGRMKELTFGRARKHLGRTIRMLRLKRRLTQEQLAERAGIDVKHLQKAEYAELNITLRTLVRIARGLGLSSVARLFR